jgi:hypothetical protein
MKKKWFIINPINGISDGKRQSLPAHKIIYY